MIKNGDGKSDVGSGVGLKIAKHAQSGCIVEGAVEWDTIAIGTQHSSLTLMVIICSSWASDRPYH
jgi:hypothetical protein